MELQTTQSNIRLDSARYGQKKDRNAKYKSKRAIDGRRNAQLRQKTILQFRKDLYDKFQQFNIAQSIAKVQACFHKLLGRHSVISYCDQYNFKQQWQVSNRQQNKEQYRTTFMYGLFNFIRLLIINFCIWFVSVEVFFQVQKHQWIYFLIASVSIIEIFKGFTENTNKSIKIRLYKLSKQIICLLISIISIVLQKYFYQIKYFGIVFLVLLYLKSGKIYENIKIFHISSKHRQLVQIIQLFILLLSISHIFALLLYSTTRFHTNNWMTKINIHNEEWITKYIYSLYFSCSTLLTVGYGDIYPTNIIEILTILLTQLIGVATFAYAVNKIGVTLSNITQRTQKMQKDLGNVEAIGNQYKLKPELICRMRTQLIKQKNLEMDLNINQENQLFNRFSEDLRQQISLQSSMRVIKRSMFMIGNWTGKLQSKIARKLEKQIYAVEQILPQLPGKQKIYILDKGKIDVINNSRLGFKRCFQKILKTLNVASNNEVLVENVYGYSAVISNREIRLNAIAKLNSICYSLSKVDLYQLLAECEQDLQHFHEIKSKIQLSKIPQQLEAPSIINLRQHYCPSVHFIIAENYHKKYTKNRRISVLRGNRKTRTKIYNKSYPQLSRFSRKQKMHVNNINAQDMESLFAKFQESWSQKDTKYDQINKLQSFSENQIIGFQSCKQYQRFFKKANYQNILNCLGRKLYSGNIQTINAFKLNKSKK